MKSITQPNELSIDCGIDKQRDIVRKSLNAIANDIRMALRDAGLHFRVSHRSEQREFSGYHRYPSGSHG